MKRSDQLRAALFRAKEQFDRDTFDQGFTRDERLAKWQAFLAVQKPMMEQIKDAERYERRGRVWRAPQPAGTAATL